MYTADLDRYEIGYTTHIDDLLLTPTALLSGASQTGSHLSIVALAGHQFQRIVVFCSGAAVGITAFQGMALCRLVRSLMRQPCVRPYP